MELRNLFGFSVFIFFCIQGCGGAIYDIGYVPDHGEVQQLSGLPSKNFLIKVEDDRPDGEREFVGSYMDFLAISEYTSELPPDEIISNSLETMLLINGHKVLKEVKKGTPSLTLIVKLKTFYQEFNRGNIGGPNLFGNIDASVDLSDSVTGKSLFNKEVNTSTADKLRSGFANAYEIPYSNTIRLFIRKIILDDDFLAALRNCE